MNSTRNITLCYIQYMDPGVGSRGLGPLIGNIFPTYHLRQVFGLV